MTYGTRRFNAAFTRALPFQIINRVPRLRVMFLNKIVFYSVRLLALRQTPKLEDHTRSAVHDCIFNTLAANLQI